jgi:two-component system chemotaxis sensor kinase CheA
MGGFALTKAIRADPTLTHIPVLILSSGSTDEDRQRGLDAGANGHLDKGGFDEASLLSAVGQLLGAKA